MSFTLNRNHALADVELQSVSTLPSHARSAAGQVESGAVVSNTLLPTKVNIGAPMVQKRKAEGDEQFTGKKLKGEIEKIDIGLRVLCSSDLTSKRSSRHQNVSNLSTFTDSYEQVRRSESGWASKLWNPVWGTAEYITLNEKYDEYFIKHHPSIATFPGEPQGDLDNAIEPLLGREHWLLDGFVQNPDLLWVRMEQALRMVSMFLTTPQVMTAWAPLVQGEEVRYQGSETMLLSYDDESRKNDILTAIGSIREAFAELVGKVKFTFVVYSKFKDLGEDFGPTHGVHYAPGDQYVDEVLVRGDPLELEAHKDAHKIFLNGAYAEFFQQNLAQVSASQYARTLFTFGTTIVHELSHVLYWHVNRAKLSEVKKYQEPLLFEDEEAGEIGCPIERRLFGCNWTAVIHPRRGVDTDCVQFLVSYIEPRWMQALLTKARWEEICETPLASSSGVKWPKFRLFLTRKNLSAKDMSNVKWDIFEPVWEMPMVGQETGPNGQPVRCFTEAQISFERGAAEDRDRKSLRTKRAAVRTKRKASEGRSKEATGSRDMFASSYIRV